jgi:hypothetical protein
MNSEARGHLAAKNTVLPDVAQWRPQTTAEHGIFDYDFEQAKVSLTKGAEEEIFTKHCPISKLLYGCGKDVYVFWDSENWMI